MKTTKLIVILLVFAIAITLCACAAEDTPYSVVKNGIQYMVDPQQCMISDGTHTYRYEYRSENRGNSQSYTIYITYPNGSSYTFSKRGSTGVGSASVNYDDKAYAPGEDLCAAVTHNMTKSAQPVSIPKMIAALVLIGLGILDIRFPYISWYLSHGWRFKDAEPSDAALSFGRIGGVVLAILGVILLVSAFIG